MYKNETGVKGNTYRSEEGYIHFFVGKPESKTPIGRPNHRCEYNIKMNLQEEVCEGIDWITLAHDSGSWRALLNAVINIRVP